jgi:glycerophosphoryl diester phosphodiesterase
MAKTVDRQVVNGQEYMLMDSSARESAADLKSAVNKVYNKDKLLFAENFDVGNISISGSGWTYNANAKRVRTKENYTIRLNPGDVISLSDYTDARMYIGWQRLSGVYRSSEGWLTQDFLVYDAGDYVINMSNIEEKVQSGVQELYSLLNISIHSDAVPNAFSRMTFRAVNHQGYTPTAPNNTLPAFAMSKIMGFNIVETDVRFTSDNVPVLSHDDDISGKSDGTGNISEMTYAQLLQYDFGSWKNVKYTGTRIPTFEQFLALARSLNLMAYIDLKVCDDEKAELLTDLVRKYGMVKHVTWIGDWPLLKYIVSHSPYSRIGLLVSSDTDATQIASYYNSLLSGANDVFIDVNYGAYTASKYYNAISALKCPVEVWTLNSFDYFSTQEVAKNVTGVTTDSMLYDQLALDDATAAFDEDHYKIPTIKAFTDLLDIINN